MGLRRLSEDDVPHLGSASLQTITWSIVSGFKGLENDVVILAALTDIETDWHRGVAYVGMSRARTREAAVRCVPLDTRCGTADTIQREPRRRSRMRRGLARLMLEREGMSDRHLIFAAVTAAVAVAISSLASAQAAEHVPTSSIRPLSELWTYEAPFQFGGTPDERLTCGRAAMERGASILETWGAFWCRAAEKGSGIRECGVGRKPSGDWHLSYERGARLRVDKSGQHYLVMAYRRDISDVSFAELRRQRAFLDRIGTVKCDTHGPWTVWHPKTRSPFAKKIEHRLIEGDRALLPREPRLRQQIEAEWEYMTGEGNGQWCVSCGRNAPLCAECALVTGMGCNQYKSVLIAPDSDGRVRIIEMHDVEPGEVPFGQGVSEAPVRAAKQ